MGDNFPRARTAIAGIATYGLGDAPGYSSIELAAKAGIAAVADAGLALRDVDALFICLPARRFFRRPFVRPISRPVAAFYRQ